MTGSLANERSLQVRSSTNDLRDRSYLPPSTDAGRSTTQLLSGIARVSVLKPKATESVGLKCELAVDRQHVSHTPWDPPGDGLSPPGGRSATSLPSGRLAKRTRQ